MGGLGEKTLETLLGVANPAILMYIKHPNEVESVRAVLQDGSVVNAGYCRPQGLSEYRIRYKPDGMYQGRVQRVTLDNLRNQGVQI